MSRVQSMLLPLLGMLALVPGPASAQVIDVTPRSFDFGTMKQEETRAVKVTVTNKGGARLIISDVKADCGCTVPEMKVKELGPGESAPLNIEFNSKHFNGNVVKMVQIFSNDPSNGVAEVMITAKVHASLIIDPETRRLGFPTTMVGDEAKVVATFTAVDAAELELRDPLSSHGRFDVEVHNKVDGDPRKAELVVSLPADVTPGTHRDNIRVSTNLPEMPSVDFEAKAQITAPILVDPDVLSFRFQPRFNLNMRIKPFDERIRFKVLAVSTDLPELKLGKMITVKDDEFIIPISGAPIAPDNPRALDARGRIKGSIIIKTDLPAMPRIEIPVTYMIRM